MLNQTACIIKPDGYVYKSSILDKIFDEGFTIRIAGTFDFTDQMVDEFYAEHLGKPFYPNLLKSMVAGPVIGLVLLKSILGNAVEDLRDLIGPATISERVYGQLRHMYGHPTIVALNAIHGSDSAKSAQREIELIFKYIWFGA